MAFVRTIVKISGSSLLNINKHVNSSGVPISFKHNCNIFKQNIRAYWSGKSKIIISKFYKDYEYKCLSKNCGKLPPSRIEPYKEQFSKCLEDYNKPVTKSRRHLFKFKKSSAVIKKKPTNRHKVEPKKVESSLWKNIFRTKSKKSSSCVFPMTYRKQMTLHQQDPRLSNPCYQSTPGDVLIYTKIINAKKLECHEPQPRLTPPYKVSRAALCKMIIADIEKTVNKSIIASPQNHSCSSTIFKINAIPFQEMRPSDKKKKAFTCKDGVSEEDIIYPSNTANSFSITKTNFHPFNM